MERRHPHMTIPTVLPARPSFRSGVGLRAGSTALFLFGAILPAQALAQETELIIGPGAVYVPDYEGSADNEIQPFPFISFNYRDIVFIRGGEIGANLRTDITSDMSVSVGPLLRYRRDRKEKRNVALRGLGNVDTSVEAGGFVRLESGNFWAQAAGGKDILDGHGGIVADLQLGTNMEVAENLSASLTATGTWTDDNYSKSFFGVTQAQSGRSGLPVYSPGSGFKDVGATAGLTYSLSEHWMASAFVGYTRLLGDAADSPLVRLRGKEDQLSGGVFIGYRF